MVTAHPTVPARTVDVVVDFVCVDCYLAFTRFRRAAHRYRARGGIVHTDFHPFRIRPDASVEGEPLFAVHARERGEAFARRVAADTTIGAADGLDIRLGTAAFTNTGAAHRLVARAAEQGLAEEMTERVFRAYFTDGVNIAEALVLGRLAAEVGLVRPESVALDAVGTPLTPHSQVGPVPRFRFDDGTVLEGSLPQDRYDAALAT